MYSEILNFKPQLDGGDLRKMERSLATRLGNVGKKFGKGLLSGLAGGGLAGVGLSILEKLLNPLKETQEAIDRTLKTAGDIVSNANQFGTTPGRLARLTAFGAAKGLDQGDLFQALGKFQSAVAEAKIDPTKPTAVRQFTSIPDTAEAFYEFIQALKKLPKELQIAAETEVFGEKSVLKLADFINSDQGEIQDSMPNLPSAARLDTSLAKGDRLSTLAQALDAQRNVIDLDRKLGGYKSGLINEPMIRARDEQQNRELERENSRIGNYNNLMTLNTTADKILMALENGTQTILTEMLKLIRGGYAELVKMGFMRGLKGMFQGKDN